LRRKKAFFRAVPYYTIIRGFFQEAFREKNEKTGGHVLSHGGIAPGLLHTCLFLQLKKTEITCILIFTLFMKARRGGFLWRKT
jgi:hypothetical protein